MMSPKSIFVFIAILIFLNGIHCHTVHAQDTSSHSLDGVIEKLSSEDVEVSCSGSLLSLKPNPSAISKKKFSIPRLCAPLKSIAWESGEGPSIKFVPEIHEWVFSWKGDAPKQPCIKVVFDERPVLPNDNPKTIPAGDGSILFRADDAMTFGEKLRYEPQWYKNTVGYWTIPTDYATWQFSVDQPGTFTVAVLQGCGKGQGGSDALISVRKGDAEAAKLSFKTIDTGHFQNFRWNHLGQITIDEIGDYELRITPEKIAKNALFDVRRVHLVRQAKPIQ